MLGRERVVACSRVGVNAVRVLLWFLTSYNDQDRVELRGVGGGKVGRVSRAARLFVDISVLQGHGGTPPASYQGHWRCGQVCLECIDFLSSVTRTFSPVEQIFSRSPWNRAEGSELLRLLRLTSLLPHVLTSSPSAHRAQKLSESMNVEMAPKGIHVQCQVPLMVATKLSKIRKPKWDAPSPSVYAKAGVAAIGHEAVVSPYWSHKFQLWVLGVVPSSANFVFSLHKSLRARALKKLGNKVE